MSTVWRLLHAAAVYAMIASVSTNSHFREFSASFVARLTQQTGLSLGDYAALVMAGQNPSHPSAVYAVSKKMRKRLRKKKQISNRDISKLLDMVDEYLEFQELGPKDRITFARQIMQKVLPSLTAANLEMSSQGEVSKIQVDEEFRDDMRSLVSEFL